LTLAHKTSPDCAFGHGNCRIRERTGVIVPLWPGWPPHGACGHGPQHRLAPFPPPSPCQRAAACSQAPCWPAQASSMVRTALPHQVMLFCLDQICIHQLYIHHTILHAYISSAYISSTYLTSYIPSTRPCLVGIIEISRGALTPTREGADYTS